MRKATVPAAVASPVVSVSRQTSGTSGGGWPGSVARRSRSTGSRPRPASRSGRTSPPATPDDLAVERRRQPLGEVVPVQDRPVGVTGDRLGGSRRVARPEALEAAGEAGRSADRGRHPVGRRARSRHGRAELGQEAQGERLRVDARLQARTGAGRAAAVAAARRDEVGRAGEQLVVPLPQPLRQADPARDRLVEVDGRLLRVRRADLGRRARGRADRPSAAPTRRSGSPARRRAARRRGRRGASGRGRRRRSASRPSSGARARAGRSGPSRRSRRSGT